MEIITKTKETVKETNRHVLSQSLGMISSAFVLVAALAWNDAIRELISTYFKAGGGLISRIIYALLVTIVAVTVATRLNRLSEKYKPQPEGDAEKK